jgi:hypothetical protein
MMNEAFIFSSVPRSRWRYRTSIWVKIFPSRFFHFTIHPLAELLAALLYKPNYKYIPFRFILIVFSRLRLRIFTSGFLKNFFMYFSNFLWSLRGLSVTSSWF